MAQQRFPVNVTYSIWYGLSGTLIEYSPERGNPAKHSVRAYNVDTHTVYYVERSALAQALRDARNLAHMNVAIYSDRRPMARNWR